MNFFMGILLQDHFPRPPFTPWEGTCCWARCSRQNSCSHQHQGGQHGRMREHGVGRFWNENLRCLGSFSLFDIHDRDQQTFKITFMAGDFGPLFIEIWFLFLTCYALFKENKGVFPKLETRASVRRNCKTDPLQVGKKNIRWQVLRRKTSYLKIGNTTRMKKNMHAWHTPETKCVCKPKCI